MTILTRLNAGALAEGTVINDLPGWSVGANSGAQLDAVARSGKVMFEGSGVTFGTLLYDYHQPVIRGAAAVPYGGSIVPVALDHDNYISLSWVHTNDGNYALFTQLPVWLDGYFDEAATAGHRWQTFFTRPMPPVTWIEWIVAGNQVSFRVNGLLLSEYPAYQIKADYGPTLTLPDALVGGTRAGFNTAFGIYGPGATAFEAGDTSGLVRFSGVGLERADIDHQRLTFALEGDQPGPASITVLGADGSPVLSPFPANVGVPQLSPALPTSAEGGWLTVRAEAGGDTAEVGVKLEQTIALATATIGQNISGFSWFCGFMPFNDMTKLFTWVWFHQIVMPDWYVASPAVQSGNVSRTAAGFSARGVPMQWQSGGEVIEAAAFYSINADQVDKPSILTLPPGLDFDLTIPSSGYGWDPARPKYTLVKDLITGQHQVTFHTRDLWYHAFSIKKNHDPATGGGAANNYGLPQTEWADQFSWYMLGADQSKLVAPGYQAWYSQAALTHVRTMQIDGTQEASLLYGCLIPDDFYTATTRLHPDEVSWSRYGIEQAPMEWQVELAQGARIGLWHAFPRGVQESFVRDWARLVRDRLDPALPLYVESGNEEWLFSYGGSGGRMLDGYQANLGAPDALYGQSYAPLYPDGVLPPLLLGLSTTQPGEQQTLPAIDFDTVPAGTTIDPNPPTLNWAADDERSFAGRIYRCVEAPAGPYQGTVPIPADVGLKRVGGRYLFDLGGGVWTDGAGDLYDAQSQYVGADPQPQANNAKHARALELMWGAQSTYNDARDKYYLPGNGSTKWTLLQTGPIARIRANKQATLQLAAWIRDELGPSQAARVRPVGNLQMGASSEIDEDLHEEYLAWGAQALPDGRVDTGIYALVFGGYTEPRFQSGTGPATVFTAAPGPPRRAAMRATVEADTNIVVDQQVRHRRVIDAHCDAMHYLPVTVGYYESGVSITYAVPTPDQAWVDDANWHIDTLAAEERVRLVRRTAEQVGGPLTMFADMQPYYRPRHWDDDPGVANLRTPSSGLYFGNIWAVSDGTDRDAYAYQLMQQLGRYYGGQVIGLIPTPTLHVGRRRATAWLALAA